MLSIAFARWGENPHHLVVDYPPQLFRFFSQSAPRPRYPRHRGLRIPERRKIISHREHIGYHPTARFRNLYKVRRRPPLRCNLLAELHAPALRRCPTECQLSRSNEPWTCVVSLRMATEDGSVLAQPRRVDFGDPITSKADVTERIRRAQCAILNPHTPSLSFLNCPLDTLEERQLSFSHNSVCLEISGKDVDDCLSSTSRVGNICV